MNSSITIRPDIVIDAISRFKVAHDKKCAIWMEEAIQKEHERGMKNWFRRPRSEEQIKSYIKLEYMGYLFNTPGEYGNNIVNLTKLVKIAIQEHVLITITQESVNLLYEYLIHE